MVNVKENNMVDARDLHSIIEVKTRFDIFLKRGIENLRLVEGKDFCPILVESTGGRPRTEYDITVETAINLCITAYTKKSADIRAYLIELLSKRNNLELITIKESAFAFKVIQCLKYVENQKEALEIHKTTFVGNLNSKDYVYQRFNNFRNSIIGWDKEKVDKAIKEYQENTGHRVKSTSLTDKINVLDTPEAIRIACLDVLYSKGEIDNAHKFSEMVKKLSKEMEVKSLAKNENNLFQHKEDVNVKLLTS
jgi:phage anti-repressor protein